MLTAGIWQNYATRLEEILKDEAVELVGKSKTEENGALINQAIPTVAKITAKEFLKENKYKEEIFGPWSLVVVAEDKEELQTLVAAIDGQLTATVMAEDNELTQYTSIIQTLQEKAGRLIFNGVPTGVEVTAAMQHGGPFPATNDSRFTSVGTGAIKRFVRPLAWQDWPDSLLPDELKNENPLNIYRLVDGNRTRNLNEQ
jgi:NADP-dependent aldehyde dehydrogenase